MDRLIYVAMTGAANVLHKQAGTAQNLANVSTHGYRAQTHSFHAVPVFGDGAPTRAFAVDTTIGTDFQAGALQATGRDLDVAVEGKGWIAVQGRDGREAYTRNGSLQVTANGQVVTRAGHPVIGDAGPLAVPPDSRVTVGGDGTVSVLTTGSPLPSIATVGRIKLVNPPEQDMVRGDDGLFRLASGRPAPADALVQLTSGALEASNVNVAGEMVNLISESRHFETQMQLLRRADENAGRATQLLAAAR